MQIDKKINQLLKKCFYRCKKIDTILFDDNNEQGALCYLNLALADMSVLKSICYSNMSSIKNLDALEELFVQFDEYATEVTNNFVTNHSHQWSNSEYENLMNLFSQNFGIKSNS